MRFARLTSETTETVLDFMRQHADALMRRRLDEPDAARQLFHNRAIYGHYEGDQLVALIFVPERNHLTWKGKIYFPFVIIPKEHREREWQALSGFLTVWRAEQSAHWRRMIIYDDTADARQASFLTAEGFRMVSRHLKHVRDLNGGPPTAEEFPRVAEALSEGYTLSAPTVSEIEADSHLTDQLVAVRNATFALRGDADQWTRAEMLRQMKVPGAMMIVVWHSGMPVGLALLFHIQDGEDKGEAYVSEIVVQRRHWGKVAADLLGFEMLRRCCAIGAQTIAGVADERNRASRNLMERFGLTVRKVSTSWHLEMPPSVSQ